MSGAALEGFRWWYFAYPTQLDQSISDWVTVTNGDINLGGTVGTVPTHGLSYTIWNDPAITSLNPGVTIPADVPVLQEPTPSGNTFTISVPNGSVPATIDVSTAMGSATLVYQVDRTNGIVTVSPIDVTTQAGLTTLSNALANAGTPVKAYGVPQLDASLKAYVLTYFTGTTLPAM